MDIRITWFNDQFNVALASTPESEEFVSIKGARIVDGSKGPFVSWPATKNQSTGKYWAHIWGSEKFNAVVLSKAQASMPTKSAPRRQAATAHDDSDSIPF